MATLLVSSLILAACGDTAEDATPTTNGPLVSTTVDQPETTTTSSTTTTVPPTTTTTTGVVAGFETVAGTPPHELNSYLAEISISMAIDETTVEVSGGGVFAGDAFSCDWTVSVPGQEGTEYVKGSPETVWLGSDYSRAVLPDSIDAQRAQALCPSSPVFWTSYTIPPEGPAEPEVKNDVPSNRFDVSEQIEGLPGLEFGQLPGVSIERANVWQADPGGWISAIELIMSISADAATSMWGVELDSEAGPSEMVYTVDVFNPDDATLEVSLPDAVDLTVGFGSVTVTGEPLTTYDSSTLDTALYTIAPTITGADWDGAESTIGPDGRPKIIVFLAHWCPHCQNEVPLIMEWMDSGNLPAEVDFYSATVMTDQSRGNWPPQAWLEGEGWDVPVVMDDAAGSIAFSYGVPAVPFFVVLGDDNTTLMRIAGGLDERGLDILVQIALGG